MFILESVITRLFHIMLKNLPVIPFSNAAKVTYYAIDPPLLFHVVLSTKIYYLKHYNNNTSRMSLKALTKCVSTVVRYM